jgi:hypothetical protein
MGSHGRSLRGVDEPGANFVQLQYKKNFSYDIP